MFVTHKHNTFYAVIYGGLARDGSEIKQWMPLKATSCEAAEMEAAIRFEGGGPEFVALRRKVRLRDFAPEWLEFKLGLVRYATHENYEQHVRLWIVPGLGQCILREMDAWAIRRFQSSLGTTPGRLGPLSPKYRFEIMLTLKLLLKDATSAKLTDKDVGLEVTVKAPPRHKVVPLTDDQSRRLLKASKGTWLYPAVLLGLMGGLRIGEVRALDRPDIDFDAGTVHVHHTMTASPGGEEVGPPKTDAGDRVLDLNGWVLDELREFYSTAPGSIPANSPVLLAPGSLDRTPYTTFQDDYYALAHELGIPTRFHDLRHTHATQLLRAGAGIKVVSIRLGHEDEAFTLRTYVHLMPGDSKDAVRRLDSVYRPVSDEAA